MLACPYFCATEPAIGATAPSPRMWQKVSRNIKVPCRLYSRNNYFDLFGGIGVQTKYFSKTRLYFTFRSPENISKILQEEWNVTRCERLALARYGGSNVQVYFGSIHLSRRRGGAGCKLGGLFGSRCVPSQSGISGRGNFLTASQHQGRPAPPACNGPRMLLEVLAEL